MPAGDDLAAVTSLYTRMGFPGCVGSTDCVHFYWDRCPHNVRHLHLGKEGKPTVAYSLVADHTRRIRSLTIGTLVVLSSPPADDGVLGGDGEMRACALFRVAARPPPQPGGGDARPASGGKGPLDR